MAFPPGPTPPIPDPPARGTENWDTPLDATLTALTDGFNSNWQNDVDAAVVIGRRAITPVTNAGTEISNPADGQLCYITTTRVYQRYNSPSSTWVPFLTAGADGQFINTFQGAWTARTYIAGQIVTSLGSSWLATGAAIATQVPGTDSVWTNIASSGIPGTNGNTVLNGSANPTTQGVNGDFYINTTSNTIWGPKASGSWPGSGVSIVGPQGPAGQGVITGGATGTYLKKTASGDFATAWGSVVDADINTLGSVTNKALDSAVVHNTGAETIAGVKTFSSAPVVPAASFGEDRITGLVADLAAKLALAGGTVTGTISETAGAATSIGLQTQVNADTNQRMTVRVDGQHGWGSGAAATDTTLRRSGVGVLATDNTFGALTGIQVGAVSPAFGGGVGVMGVTNAATAPTTNPSGGGIFYAASGQPTWRDPSGNVWNLVPSNRNSPADQNLIAWSFEPQLGNGTPSALTAGVILLSRVVLRTAATITNIIMNVAVAAVGNSNTWVGLYDFTGTRQGLSADQSTPFQTTGTKTVALSSTYAAPAGNYWVAVLVGAASTLPQISGASSTNVPASFANVGLTAATARWATSGSGLTALPTTITPGSNTLSSNSLAVALS